MFPNTFRELESGFDLMDFRTRQMPITVEFTNEIRYMECYAEKGMRANITNITIECDCICVYFDYTQFDDYNKQFESSNYYDNKGNPVLSAREAGYYRGKEAIYFDLNADPNNYFSEVGNPHSALYNAYLEDRSSGETYIAFLERVAKEALGIE